MLCRATSSAPDPSPDPDPDPDDGADGSYGCDPTAALAMLKGMTPSPSSWFEPESRTSLFKMLPKH